MFRVLCEQAADKVFELFRVPLMLNGLNSISQNGGQCRTRILSLEREAKGAQLIGDDSDGPYILLVDIRLR